ncbi:MAG: Gfo/Idh/MocA family protein [Spirochaetaceae bacterium]
MEQTAKIRIAFIGAGQIARSRHLPNLAAIEDAEVRVVVNRSEESSRAVASQFGIPEIESDYRRVLERDDIDAVFIGTWPYMHSEISTAALEAGKHVFCQARMACTLDEARDMVAAARAWPQLVTMICPPPHRMPWEPYIRRLMRDGSLGDLWTVRVRSLSGANLGSVATWREQVEFSGVQTLAVGIYAETLNAWVGEYDSLSARTSIPIREKTDEGGSRYTIRVPQVVSIHGTLPGGAVVDEYHSGVSEHEREESITIEGSRGTLRVDVMKSVQFAARGEELQPARVPEELLRDWRVELDFIEAVRAARRGESWTVSPDFAEGLRYMKKMEAISRSARTGTMVAISSL